MEFFAEDGLSVIVWALIIGIIIAVAGLLIHNSFSVVLYVIAVVFVAFTLFFFRDPDRNIPEDPNLILAPADGTIVTIKEVDEDTYLHGKGTQISIFLSLADVHVNRNPVSGVVEYLKYFPGEYLIAWYDKASERNERAEFGVLHPSGTRVLFRQITGYVARRIVYHISEGDTIKAGHRFGMMKFGSRMDIIVPGNVVLNVRTGQKTVGGETVLGIIEAR
ncbi:MAG TPA: phosphatidylserine decarboxylase family protein [Balneolales bacterium]|nr:phosphatidylserine decarboxylase family protein [Balneolales bacterium]